MFNFSKNEPFDQELFIKEFLDWYDTGKPESNFEEIYEYNNIGQFLLCEEMFPVEDFIRGEDRRWSVWVNKIFKINNRYFQTGFDMGLTEMQENEYWDTDIEEVAKKEIIITKTVWELI